MKLIFLGTRGGIKARSKLHYQHASLLIKKRSQRIMIDCGADWLGHVNDIRPTAIVITHAHPDHVDGLKQGAPCPIYGTQAIIDRIKRFPLNCKLVTIDEPFFIGTLEFTPFALEHSLHAPAVGYRVTDQEKSFFYAPDIVSIIKREQALQNVTLYIGDGAIIQRTLLVRQRDGVRIGHSPIKEQLAWCQEAGIPKAIITHCGTEIVRGNPAQIREKVVPLARTYNILVKIAYDGMTVIF